MTPPPKGHKRYPFDLTPGTIAIYRLAKAMGDYTRPGQVLEDLASNDEKKRKKALKAIEDARKHLNK